MRRCRYSCLAVAFAHQMQQPLLHVGADVNCTTEQSWVNNVKARCRKEQKKERVYADRRVWEPGAQG